MTTLIKKKALKLAIVDDHNLFRKGLIKLINLGDKENKYTILFEAENGNDLQNKLNIAELPDIIILDIDMPGMDGYESVKWLKNHYPDINILVVSMFESEKTILRMIQLKVNGYLSKDIEVEDMHEALEAIANKGMYYSDLMTDAMAQSIHNKNNADDNPILHTLSDNESTFLVLACTELTYQQIADKMFLSPKTIDGYREALFQRFVVKNRVGLAVYAIKNGLVKI
jgi:two-component system invasion response regulator UvrY